MTALATPTAAQNPWPRRLLWLGLLAATIAFAHLPRGTLTGLWKDVGRFKGPVLRGLAGRAPYFHNGSATSLADAVNFYDVRFDLNLTQRQKDDLVAFLRSL